MTTFLLIRHAVHSLVGKSIVGRAPGVHLSAEGRTQAERLAERLADAPIRAVFSSPLERARETAQPLAERLGLPVQVCAQITEVDYGDWTGRTLQELEGMPGWREYNTFRSGTRILNGELMLETQARMVSRMEALRREHPDGVLALVGHSDPLRAAVVHYLGLPLDLAQRIEISPASVTVLEVRDWGPRLLLLNDTGELPIG